MPDRFDLRFCSESGALCGRGRSSDGGDGDTGNDGHVSMDELRNDRPGNKAGTKKDLLKKPSCPLSLT